LDFVVRKICLIISILFLLDQSISAQITIAFQGGEIGDNWNFSSTGADIVAQSEASFSSNYTSGTSSIVVGGNTGGGSCFDGGTGNGNNVANTFTFSNVDISGSSNYNRTLTFQWGNRFPVCSGTGWDSNEDLIFTAYHNGIAQPSTTLATGSGNANFNIANNQFSWNIPTCVTDFYFTLSITTNRRDELLFVDDVNLQTPALNQPIPPTSLITGNTQICNGNTQNLSVVSVPNTTYTWSGLPLTAQFTTPNNSPASNQISIDWGSTPAGTYTVQVIPSMNICGVSTDGNPTLIDITVVDNPTIVIQGATTICPGENAIISATGANTYLWDNGLGNGNQFTVSPTITTTYQVTGSIGNCVATNTVTITVVNSANIPIIATSQSICAGESVTLLASGMNNYLWQNANGLTSNTNPSVVATPTATATYNVSGTSGNCQANGSITITVNPLPIISAGIDLNLCQGDFVTLNASGGGNYLWTQNIQNGVAFQPQTTQTYSVIGTDLNGCIGSDSVLLTVNPLPIISAGNDVNLCEGDFLTLNATGGGNYIWTQNVQNGVAFQPQSTQLYSVTGIGLNGCIATDNLLITVNPLPIISAGNDVNLCEGDYLTLTATGGGNYIWSQNVQNGVAFQPQSTQIYSVTETGLNGCVGSDDVLVTIVPKPIVQFQASTLTGCSPTQTQFSTNLIDIQNYSWDFGDGNSSQEANPSHTYINNGCNDVSLTVTSTIGCTASLILADYICSDLKPTANFEINPNSLSESNLLAHFFNLSENATTYLWNFGDLTNSFETNPLHQYNSSNPDGFWVTLYAYSTQGCVDSMTQLLPLVENAIYYVPNAFTPDGNEFNQTFQPVFTTGFDPTEYEMLIFNRWGEIVFESKDASIGWDGTNFQGLMAPDGTYSWKITFNLLSSEDRKIILGHVNLTR
jgi:gliding motility-associated-like protein